MPLTTDRRTFNRSLAVTAGAVAAGGIKAAQASTMATSPNDPMRLVAQAIEFQPAESPPLAPPDRQPENLRLPDLVEREVGFAVVGLGQLAVEQLLPAFGECRLARLGGLVSGHPEKARRLASVYGEASRALSIYDYENFDTIRDDEGVDAVYIALPNSMHAELTIRALQAGKHVLCEKPMATSVEECQRMISTAQAVGRKLMIAYRLHYEPYNQKVVELSRNSIGDVKLITASNCQNTQAPNIRLSAALGGGPIGDVGIYCINAGRYITGEEPAEVRAVAFKPDNDPRFQEVPESVSFSLRYPSGIVAECQCSFGTTSSRHMRIIGTEGYVDLDNAFAYEGQVLKLKKGSEAKGDETISELKVKRANHFASEMDHLAQCVLSDTAPRTPGEMGLADQRIIAAIDEAWKSGRRVALL